MKIVSPIDKIYVTQHFGERPEVYKQFGLKGHNGTDFRTRFWDTPLARRYVVSVMDGTVIEVGNQGKKGYGIFVRIRHRGTEQTVSAHLTKPYVFVGQKVVAGQRIGLTGNTGFSSGPHLHFGWRPDKWKQNNGFAGYEDPRKLLKGII